MTCRPAPGIRTGHTPHPSRLLAAIIVAALWIAGCSATDDDGSADDAADPAPSPTTSSSAPTTAAPTTTAGPDPTDLEGIWISPGELSRLPMEGPAWTALVAHAEADWGDPDLGNQDSNHDTDVLAGALVAVRRVDAGLRARVVQQLEGVTGAFPDDVLPVARNLPAYVIAADLVDLRDPAFDAWITSLLDHTADSRAGIRSLRESADRDPSNHGTHARAAVLAIALRVGDDVLVDQVAGRFRAWLGESSDGWEWRELDWQADPARPVGVNPVGASIDGLDVDGVLPEEQRRSGDFTTDPEKEGYVWEALQGAVVTAELLDRAGHPAWTWSDRALSRAFRWLHDVNDFPAVGDDSWQPWLVNAATGDTWPSRRPSEPGKNMGYTDWTHGTTG